MINRQSTQHGVGDIKKGPALWKLIHAVLNASTKRGLTTKEVVGALRHHFPEQHFTQANVRYSLSRSHDFQQVGAGGSRCRPWTLTGKSDGVKRRNGMTLRRSPTTFDRKFTPLILGYVDSEHCRFAMWKGCHAVLNASTRGCLTTGEVEKALRLHYPDRTIKRSTVCYNLTQSEDFKQVYPEGKTPGRWFLTGEVRGINRTNPVRAMELQLPIDIFSAGDEDYNDDESDDDNDNDDLATPPNTPPAAGLPYPSKTEEIEAQYSPDPNFSSPTWSSSLPTRATIMLATVGGVHYPQPTRANYQSFPALENAVMNESPHFDSELMTPHAQETTGTTYFNSYTGELAGLGALSGLLGPSLPSHSTSKVPLSPNTSFPNLTRGNGFLQGPSNVEFYSSPIPYQRDLGLNTSNPIGSFGGGTISTFFRQDDSAQEHTLGEFPGGWVTEDNTPRSVYCATVTGQQGVPNAHNFPAYPTYTKPNTVCSGGYDCIEVFGGWNAPEQTQTNVVVTRPGDPFGETYSYLVS